VEQIRIEKKPVWIELTGFFLFINILFVSKKLF